MNIYKGFLISYSNVYIIENFVIMVPNLLKYKINFKKNLKDILLIKIVAELKIVISFNSHCSWKALVLTHII